MGAIVIEMSAIVHSTIARTATMIIAIARTRTNARPWATASGTQAFGAAFTIGTAVHFAGTTAHCLLAVPGLATRGRATLTKDPNGLLA